MPGYTDRLHLYKPGGGSSEEWDDEAADIDKINQDMDVLDAAVGAFSCLSTTHPSSPFPGQLIHERDTELLRSWNPDTSEWDTLARVGDPALIDGLTEDIENVYTKDEVYTQDELNGGQLDTRYYTQAEVDTLLLQAWQPVVPSSVSSTGSTATLDTSTGIITVPAGCTNLKVLGVFEDGYDYLIRTREQDSFTTYTDNMKFNLLVAGVVQSATNYEMAGHYSIYSGTLAVYAANGTNYMPVGVGYTGGQEVHRELTVIQPHEALNTIVKLWNYVFGAARETVGTGSYNNSAQATGFQLATTTGSFAGTVRVFRRKALV